MHSFTAQMISESSGPRSFFLRLSRGGTSHLDAASSTVFQARSRVSDILAGATPPAGRRRPLFHPRHHGRAGVCPAAEADHGGTPQSLCIVMRVYFEKPRTTIGWKGLINDPHLNQTYKINDGLRLARHLLLDLAEMGVPAARSSSTSSRRSISSTWSPGERSARAPPRASPSPVGQRPLLPGRLQERTSGDVQIAIDAILSASHEHTFLGGTKHGQTAIFATTGNPDCHVILRGGRKLVNYDAASVDAAARSWRRPGCLRAS